MSAPTTAFTNNATGKLSTSGESNGLLLAVGREVNRVTLGFSGTFTSAVVAVRGRPTGLTEYFPVQGVNVSSGQNISSSTSISLTNSTSQAFEFNVQGCDYVEVWAVSGTLTDLNVSAWQSTAGATSPPIFQQVVTNATVQTADLKLQDNVNLSFGTGDDITVDWDGTKLVVAQAAPNSAIQYGVDGAGIDQVQYGDTAGAAMTWDQSADSLIFTGAAGIRNIKAKQNTAAAITGATTLTLADSGGIWSVAQSSAYDIDLPSPTTGAGAVYTFYLTSPGAHNVTITVAGSAATFVGTIVNDVTSVIPATGSTLTFASGASALGDTIVIKSVATNLYHVQAVTSAAGGITVS